MNEELRKKLASMIYSNDIEIVNMGAILFYQYFPHWKYQVWNINEFPTRRYQLRSQWRITLRRLGIYDNYTYDACTEE